MINLQKLIDERDIKTTVLAKELFPENKYAPMALKRVIDGYSELSSSQISKLALFLGVSIEDVFENNWKSSVDERKVIFIRTDGWRAELNTQTMITKVFDKQTLMHEVILNTKTVVLSEYLQTIERIINGN